MSSMSRSIYVIYNNNSIPNDFVCNYSYAINKLLRRESPGFFEIYNITGVPRMITGIANSITRSTMTYDEKQATLRSLGSYIDGLVEYEILGYLNHFVGLNDDNKDLKALVNRLRGLVESQVSEINWDNIFNEIQRSGLIHYCNHYVINCIFMTEGYNEIYTSYEKDIAKFIADPTSFLDE